MFWVFILICLVLLWGVVQKGAGMGAKDTEIPYSELYDKVQKKALDLAPFAWLFYREQGEATQSYVQGHEYLGSLGANNSVLEVWLDK